MTAASPGSWDVAVVIPARNEAVTIKRCVDSVLASAAVSMRCHTVWVVVVADCCTDRTAEVARRCVASQGEVLQSEIGSPGTARRLGAAAGLRHYNNTSPQRLWLANTDADTYVPLDWIDTHLRHADTDAQGVAGIVNLDPFQLRADVKALYERTYRLATDGAHEHVHGANLGVRADAYLDAGGWSDVAVAEDHCLWGRLMRRGWHLSSPVTSVVHTSGRLQGRASGGFADALRRGLLAGD